MKTKISNVQVSEQTAVWLNLMAQFDKFREDVCNALNGFYGNSAGEERFNFELYAPMEKVCKVIEEEIIQSIIATNDTTEKKDYTLI